MVGGDSSKTVKKGKRDEERIGSADLRNAARTREPAARRPTVENADEAVQEPPIWTLAWRLFGGREGCERRETSIYEEMIDAPGLEPNCGGCSAAAFHLWGTSPREAFTLLSRVKPFRSTPKLLLTRA